MINWIGYGFGLVFGMIAGALIAIDRASVSPKVQGGIDALRTHAWRGFTAYQ